MAQVVTDPATGRGRELPLHPLDPLSPAELEAIVAGVREARGLDDRHLLASVRLLEPPKAEVLAWREGDPLDRAARVEVWDRPPARSPRRSSRPPASCATGASWTAPDRA